MLGLSQVCNATEDCGPASIGLDQSSSQIESYFFTGTCHFRNEDYALAVENWEQLSQLRPATVADEELKIDVLNNLGYMKFYGFGTEQQQDDAVTLWQEAIALGHDEAEYHLCHAYADCQQSTYNKSSARMHCRKAYLVYNGQEQPNKKILAKIEFYLEQLGL